MDQHPPSYDVVVVGGGAAGLAAAVAAARSGARTALVERYGFLGGMATAGMVSTICGLYHTSSSGPPEALNAGFAETVARKIGGWTSPDGRRWFCDGCAADEEPPTGLGRFTAVMDGQGTLL